MTKQEKVLKEKHNGVRPLCKCGCNQETKYGPELRDYRDYCAGHKARVENNFQTEKSISNSKKTKAKQKELGVLIGKDSEETRRKKSESHKGEKNHMFGNTHSDKTKQVISQKGKEYFANNPEAKKANGERSRAYWAKEDNRLKQSIRQSEFISGLKNCTSKLEDYFAFVLQDLNIDFERQVLVGSKVYDFALVGRKVLIEIDGDFWHCNPKFYTPQYKIQKRNIVNDKLKNELANQQGWTLLRFWEDDVKNNLDSIKKQLHYMQK